jgi:hypothetical protein
MVFVCHVLSTVKILAATAVCIGIILTALEVNFSGVFTQGLLFSFAQQLPFSPSVVFYWLPPLS